MKTPHAFHRYFRFEIRRNYSGMSADREVVRDGSRESLPREKELRASSKVIRDRERMQRFLDRKRYESEEPEWFSGKKFFVSEITWAVLLSAVFSMEGRGSSVRSDSHTRVRRSSRRNLRFRMRHPVPKMPFNCCFAC